MFSMTALNHNFLSSCSLTPWSKLTSEVFVIVMRRVGYGFLVAYDPRRHQGMTLRRRRSRHPRSSSPFDKRRRRMPSSTTPSDDFISPRHISPGSRARGVIFSVFSFFMNFIIPHVFKRAFAYLILSLLSFRVGSFLFRDPIREALSLCGPLFSMIMLGVGCGPQVGPFLSRPTIGFIRGEGTPPPHKP